MFLNTIQLVVRVPSLARDITVKALNSGSRGFRQVCYLLSQDFEFPSFIKLSGFTVLQLGWAPGKNQNEAELGPQGTTQSVGRSLSFGKWTWCGREAPGAGRT